jgi:hypothetical protein
MRRGWERSLPADVLACGDVSSESSTCRAPLVWRRQFDQRPQSLSSFATTASEAAIISQFKRQIPHALGPEHGLSPSLTPNGKNAEIR